jgi:hypothetical protein
VYTIVLRVLHVLCGGEFLDGLVPHHDNFAGLADLGFERFDA